MTLDMRAGIRFPLALRVILWSTGLFSAFTLLAFTVFYFIVSGMLQARTDNDIIDDLTELRALYRAGGMSALHAELASDAATDGPEAVLYRVIGADGGLLFGTDASAWSGIESPRQARSGIPKDGATVLRTLALGNSAGRARLGYALLDDGVLLQMGVSLREDEAFLGLLWKILSLSLPALMLLAGLLGWLLARRALTGIGAVTEAAIDIARGDLGRRVPDAGHGDEVDRLARTFNEMLDRIQALLTCLREVTDDIAHDLRSPLARIRGLTESAVVGNPTLEDLKAAAGNTVEECDRLLQMVNTMLDITEFEAGGAIRQWTAVPVDEILADACDLFQSLAEDKGIDLQWTAGAQAAVQGARRPLQRLLANLLDNALKYTPAGGCVRVSLSRLDDRLAVEVEDSGVGIAEADLPRIFERFYRCDQSRSAPGNGLGLSLAMAIARAHGGTITVSSRRGEGSRFRLVLPSS